MKSNKKRRKKASRKAGGKVRRKRAKRATAKRTVRRRRRRVAKKKTAPKRRRRVAKKSTVKRRRRRVARKSAPKRRRRVAKKAAPKRRRRRVARKSAPKRRRSRATAPRRVGRRRVRRLKRGLYLVPNGRRRARKSYRSNRSRSRRYMRNGFASDLKSLAKTGALIIVGFFSHKALTGAVVGLLTSTANGTFAGMALVDSNGSPTIVAQWQKPITGFAVGAAELGLLSMVKAGKAETRMTIAAGVVVSFFESLVRTTLTVANQPRVLSYLEGYSNSAAYSLRGARGRRRGVRGLGVARNAGSIMPQYAPVGAFRQAAAGMGEYFKPAAGMGEYFAGPGVEGVGHYEKAGPLALQPSRSHMGQLPVDDGIRPDSNLDHVMDLAESAAGLGSGYRQAAAGTGSFRQAAAGMGEFFTASPDGSGYRDSTVPTQSQWVPNGPLWAGSTQAEAAYTESELPAGVLQGPGGNGVLSG